MSSKADYTLEEWASLARAPFWVGMLITMASPSGISGVLEESRAVSQDLLQPQTDSPLIQHLIADIQASKGQLAQPEQKLTPQNASHHALKGLQTVARLLEHKALPDEAVVFKDWLMLIAQDTAQAAKEGGFLGIGGTQVNQAEEKTLQQIREALG